MKLLFPIIFVVLVGGAFSSLATVSLTVIGMSCPATAFFSFFRRRPVPSVVEHDNPAPKGPVKFPQRFASNPVFQMPFTGSNRFFSGGMLQRNPFQILPPWSQSTNIPQRNQFQQSRPRQELPPQFQQSERPLQELPPQFQQSESPLQEIPPQFQQSERPLQELPPEFQQSQFQQSQFQQSSMQQFETESDSFDEQPTINTEEAESFFTLLAETDENKCISRLVCELGADPGNAGELSTTIADIIGSLTDFPHGSKVSEYNDVLQKGKSRGISSCSSEYASCDQESYQLMRDTQNEQTE